jgi:hypothetical protein
MNMQMMKRLLGCLSSNAVLVFRNLLILPLFCFWLKGLRRGWTYSSSLHLFFRDLIGWFLGAFDFQEFDCHFCKSTGRCRLMGDFKYLVIAGASRRTCFDWLPECSPSILRRAWLGALVLVMRERRDVRWLLASRKPGRFMDVLGCVADTLCKREAGVLLHRGLIWWMSQCRSRGSAHGKGNAKPENVMLGLIASTQDELDYGLHHLLQCGAGGYWLHLPDLKEPLNLRLVGEVEGLEIDALAEGRISMVLFSGSLGNSHCRSVMDQCNSAGIAYAWLDLDKVYLF